MGSHVRTGAGHGAGGRHAVGGAGLGQPDDLGQRALVAERLAQPRDRDAVVAVDHDVAVALPADHGEHDPHGAVSWVDFGRPR
ncbi:hypothetical protein ACFQYP_44520 [Nonomuraea antimicrobica]